MEGDVGFLAPASVFTSPSSSSCVSSGSGCGSGGGGSGFGSPTWLSDAMLLNSPSSCVSSGSGGGSGFCSPLGVSAERGRGVHEVGRLLRALLELSGRYDDCFLQLQEATGELAGLRRERLRLTAENLHLTLLLEELEVEQRKRCSEVVTAPPAKPVAAAATGGGGAPKSISIRSEVFLSQPTSPGDTKPQRLRVLTSPAKEETGKKEGEEGVEVEVYRQGAEKTELCNKWERGSCPYGSRCRFAHGLEELRPVIRHPRYKTLPCHMFSGAGCPYGHRCHFRHSPAPTAKTS